MGQRHSLGRAWGRQAGNAAGAWRLLHRLQLRLKAAASSAALLLMFQQVLNEQGNSLATSELSILSSSSPDACPPGKSGPHSSSNFFQ